VLVGVGCRGIADRRKVQQALGEHEALGSGEDAMGNVRAVVEDGTEVALRRQEVLADACLQCRCPTPLIHDVLLGDPVDARPADAARRRMDDFESKPLDVRWARFQEMISRCIRCNACRAACPMCYCQECLLDQARPRWLGAGTDISDVAIYHLIRAFHLAGRCAECGACARACPMGLDTCLLARKMSLDVEDLYGYRPGESTDGTPPLSTFSMDDPQEFLTEPSPVTAASGEAGQSKPGGRPR
jgi:ferredoxin